MSKMIYPINQEQKDFAANLAKEIEKKKNGIKRTYETNKSNYESRYLGCLAETVIADVVKQPRPKDLNGNGDKYDFIFQGKKFDLKATIDNGKKKHLLVHKNELKKEMDGYIRALINEKEVIVLGYAWRAEIESGEKRLFSGGINKCVPIEKLHPFEELFI